MTRYFCDMCKKEVKSGELDYQYKYYLCDMCIDHVQKYVRAEVKRKETE